MLFLVSFRRGGFIIADAICPNKQASFNMCKTSLTLTFTRWLFRVGQRLKKHIFLSVVAQALLIARYTSIDNRETAHQCATILLNYTIFWRSTHNAV